MAEDPVCHMTVDEKAAMLKTEHVGRICYVCSPMCMRQFLANLGRYIKSRKPPVS